MKLVQKGGRTPARWPRDTERVSGFPPWGSGFEVGVHGIWSREVLMFHGVSPKTRQIHAHGATDSVDLAHGLGEQRETFRSPDELGDSGAGGAGYAGDGAQHHEFGPDDLERVAGQLGFHSGLNEYVANGFGARAGAARLFAEGESLARHRCWRLTPGEADAGGARPRCAGEGMAWPRTRAASCRWHSTPFCRVRTAVSGPIRVGWLADGLGAVEGLDGEPSTSRRGRRRRAHWWRGPGRCVAARREAAARPSCWMGLRCGPRETQVTSLPAAASKRTEAAADSARPMTAMRITSGRPLDSALRTTVLRVPAAVQARRLSRGFSAVVLAEQRRLTVGVPGPCRRGCIGGVTGTEDAAHIVAAIDDISPGPGEAGVEVGLVPEPFPWSSQSDQALGLTSDSSARGSTPSMAGSKLLMLELAADPLPEVAGSSMRSSRPMRRQRSFQLLGPPAPARPT